MNAPPRPSWFAAALLAAAAYLLIGRLFALPADHVNAWRLAAWGASGVAYAAHIAYEHLRLRNSARVAALHVAAGVAMGAFALAVAGMIHDATTASRIRPAWLLALAAWPAFTALPGFLGALATTTLWSRLSAGSRR